MTQPQKNLGIFLLRLDGIALMNGMVLAVNSTALVSDVQPSYNGTVLRCSEFANPNSMFIEAVLRVAGIIISIACINTSAVCIIQKLLMWADVGCISQNFYGYIINLVKHSLTYFPTKIVSNE